MKAQFSEAYYRQNWQKFLEPEMGADYINLEGDLQRTMEGYKRIGVPEAALPVIERMEAEKIAAKCTDLVHLEMQTIKEIQAGKASFGMTTQRQEIEKRGQFVKRFEFNCLQLKDFKAKHNL